MHDGIYRTNRTSVALDVQMPCLCEQSMDMATSIVLRGSRSGGETIDITTPTITTKVCPLTFSSFSVYICY